MTALSTFTFRPGKTAEIKHPRMRVKLAEVAADEEYSGSGIRIPAAWLAEKDDFRYEPVEMTWGSNGVPSILIIRREMGYGHGGEQEHAEDQIVSAGARVRLYDEDSGDEWFCGLIAQRRQLIQADPQNEAYSITAYGPEIRLAARVVTGKWYAKPRIDDKIINGTVEAADLVRDNIYRSDYPVVLNEGGLANRSFKQWKLADPDESAVGYCGVFESPDRNITIAGLTVLRAVKWTAISALRSLVELFDNYEVISPESTNWDEIENLMGQEILGELDIDGLTLPDAMRAILEPRGFGFYIEPWRGKDDKHRLVVYSLSRPGEKRKPHLSIAGSSVSSDEGAKAEVQRIDFLRDAHNVRNDITVYGNQELMQVSLTFEATNSDLYPAWDTAEYPIDDYCTDGIFQPLKIPAKHAELFDRYDTKGKDHAAYYHVWRSFVFNEDGRFSDFAGEIPNLADYGIGVDPDYARVPRPIGPTIEWADDAKTKKKPAVITLTSGGFTVDISDKVTVWPDYAGFTITEPYFIGSMEYIHDVWRPFSESRDTNITPAMMNINFLTLLRNTLANDGGQTMRIAITGTIADDKRLKARSPKTSEGSWPLITEKTARISTLNKRTVLDSLGGTADTVDDAAKGALHAARLRKANENELGHGSFALPRITRAYPPGTGVPQTAGRNFEMQLDAGDKVSMPIVREVKFRFGFDNTTEILLDSPLLELA